MIKQILSIISILNRKQKKNFLIIICIIIVGSFLEVASIYLIYQTIQYFSNPTLYLESQNTFLQIYNFLNFRNFELIIFFIFSLISLFAIKFIFLSLMYWFQFRFVNNLNVSLSANILENYLFQNFQFHLNADSSKLLRNLRDEASQFTHGAILQVINLITESLMFLSIVILLSYFETKLLITSSFFIIILTTGYYFFIKSTFKKWGMTRQKFAAESLKNAMESLHGIKDIKIFNSEKFFLSNYFKSMTMLSRAGIIVTTLNQLPRLLLETIIIFMVGVFIFYNFDKNSFDTGLLSTLGLFVVASFKLIPSITRIINSLNNITNNLPAVSVVEKELNLKKNIQKDLVKENNFEFNKKITIKDLSFKHSNRREHILEKINLEINKGSAIGIMGESGSGKSTLIDLIIGLQSPSLGNILIDENELNLFKQSWLKKIGYVPQKVYITNDTIKNNIALGVNDLAIDLQKIKKIAEQCQLDTLINRLPEGYDTKLGDRGIVVSGGELQRIGIARAMYKDSEIIILDEFTSALDKNTEIKLLDLIKDVSKSKTVIISAHKKELLDFCINIYLIDKKGLIKIK